MLNRMIRRAMQGGDIDGRAQQEMEALAKALIACIRQQMAFHGASEEHAEQEIASVLMQVFIAETDEPAAFIEGAVTQLGWQIGIRAADQLEQYVTHVSKWLANGLSAAALEPIVQPSAGQA